MATDTEFVSRLAAAVSDPRVVFRSEHTDYFVDTGQVEVIDDVVFVYLIEADK